MASSGSEVEHQPPSPEGLAAGEDRVPPGGRRHEAAVADGLDEQLHQTRGGLLPHRVPPPPLAGRLSLVSGEGKKKGVATATSSGFRTSGGRSRLVPASPQDTLVDADVAIDAVMWQNGGMSGLDHWNFVMHPVDAAMTCDPYGSYVRTWCPELSGLPDELIHKPWKCPASVLRRAGEELVFYISKKR